MGKRRKAREVVPARQGSHRRRPSGRFNNSGGVRSFRKMLPFLSTEARKQVCAGLSEVEEELYDEAATAVRVRDLRTLDAVVEEIKWQSGAVQTCRIR